MLYHIFVYFCVILLDWYWAFLLWLSGLLLIEFANKEMDVGWVQMYCIIEFVFIVVIAITIALVQNNKLILYNIYIYAVLIGHVSSQIIHTCNVQTNSSQTDPESRE